MSGDDNVSDPEQGQVFDDFIAQCAGADDQNLGAGQQRLIPPFDGFQPRKTGLRQFEWAGLLKRLA